LQTLVRVPKFRFALGMLSLVAVVGCGTGGSSPTLVHTTGNFTNGSLKGSYVYQIHGVSSVNGSVYRQVGVFTADGNGNITGGTDDSSVNAGGTAVSGVYTVGNDGTGFLTINTSLGQITLGITLVSSSKLDLIENDAALDAAGSAELQQSTAAPSGTFVFRLHQEAAAQNPNIEANEVGAFALSSGAGNGAMDQNLNGTFTSPNVTVTLNAPVSSGRGTGNLVDTSANFTTALVYYVVNNGKVVLLVTNAGAVGSGSAEAQTGGVSGGLSGNYVFGSRGDDSFLDGVATVGQFTASAGSLSGTEDVMVDGNFSGNVSVPSTCYTAGSAGGISGRVVLTNGSGAPCSGSTTQVFWMVSPSRAFFLDNSATTIEDGTADLQSGSSFSASSLKGQFVIVMDGLDRTPEQVGLSDQILARLGTLQFDGAGNLTLNELVNASGTGGGGQSPGVLKGTYTVASNGRVVANLNGNSLDLVMYTASGSQAYVLQGDPDMISQGPWNSSDSTPTFEANRQADFSVPPAFSPHRFLGSSSCFRMTEISKWPASSGRCLSLRCTFRLP